jgi:hypothetical protein
MHFFGHVSDLSIPQCFKHRIWRPGTTRSTADIRKPSPSLWNSWPFYRRLIHHLRVSDSNPLDGKEKHWFQASAFLYQDEHT